MLIAIPYSGSICMDLLVQDGWLPSYNIAAVLLQIRMALSSTEPRPARLANGNEWKHAYGTQEALDGKLIPVWQPAQTMRLLTRTNMMVIRTTGFTRAAHTHGWRVPEGTRQLVLR